MYMLILTLFTFSVCSGSVSTIDAGGRNINHLLDHTKEFIKLVVTFPHWLRIVGLTLQLTCWCQVKLTRSTRNFYYAK